MDFAATNLLWSPLPGPHRNELAARTQRSTVHNKYNVMKNRVRRVGKMEKR